MKPANLLSALLVPIALSAMGGPAAAANGGDLTVRTAYRGGGGLLTNSPASTCENVKFTVTNNHFEGREIEIRQIKFFNPHTGKTQTENVKNKVCKNGDTCTTDGDNLANADKVDLRDFQVVFKYREHDKGWSKEFQTQKFTPKYPKCGDNSKYGPIVVKDSN
jgi:hypothetical protein